jgi:hypothetical protein
VTPDPEGLSAFAIKRMRAEDRRFALHNLPLIAMAGREWWLFCGPGPFRFSRVCCALFRVGMDLRFVDPRSARAGSV